jgi:hypothetical protein
MPPIQGWLVVGLWVVEKVSGQLFEITKVTRNRVTMVDQGKDRTREFRLDYLHEYCFACNYFECDFCRKSQGTLPVCATCEKRRIHFEEGPRHDNRRVCELPRFCKNKFIGGTFPLDPFKEPEKPLPTTRFEREWVI